MTLPPLPPDPAAVTESPTTVIRNATVMTATGKTLSPGYVVIEKGRMARDAGLAGVFAWELSQDNGDILNAMNYGVGNLPLQP